jgi:hypothetical protein
MIYNILIPIRPTSIGKEDWGEGGSQLVSLISLELTGPPLQSFGFTWSHLVSLGPTWSHLDTLSLSWSQLGSSGHA